MGVNATTVANFAQHETPASMHVIGTRLPSRRSGNAGTGCLFVQIHQQESGRPPGASDDEGQSFSARYFLRFIDAGETPGQSVSPMLSQTAVMLDEAALAERCPRWRQFAFMPIAADHGLAAVVRSHIAMMAEHSANMDSVAAAAMAPLTIGLIAALLNALDTRVAPGLTSLAGYHRKRIREFVLNNLCNPMLGVDMVARAVGLSIRYIHHLFESESVSLMQWIICKRLERCRELLIDHRRRHWKISQIAYDAGFNDLAHFSRSFRKHFSVSPTQARLACSL